MDFKIFNEIFSCVWTFLNNFTKWIRKKQQDISINWQLIGGSLKNTGSMVGIPWGGGDTQTYHILKNLIGLIALIGSGDAKILGTNTCANDHC